MHPSYNFNAQTWKNIPDQEKARLREERNEYKRLQRRISSAQSSPGSVAQGCLPPQQWYPAPYDGSVVPPPPPQPANPPPSHISMINTGGQSGSGSTASIGISPTRGTTMMGGRNDQANMRQNQQRQDGHINAVCTSVRYSHQSKVQVSTAKVQEPPAGQVSTNEADSNADTCCLGNNFVILSYTNKTADVYPYDDLYTPLKNVPIVLGATAYDDPISGNTFILVFNESLYYGEKLKHSLINPNQVRHNLVGFWDNPYDENHNLCIETKELDIPLRFIGTKLIFKSRVPTMQELANCTHIDMTSSHDWNPGSVELKEVTVASHQLEMIDFFTSIPPSTIA